MELLKWWLKSLSRHCAISGKVIPLDLILAIHMNSSIPIGLSGGLTVNQRHPIEFHGRHNGRS
jgi:hypothetical protein